MTNKKECAGSYSVIGYTRADGVEVSGYTRTCGAAHNSNSYDGKTLSLEDKMQRRADILYPDMNIKDKNLKENTTSFDNTFFSGETRKRARSFITKKEGFSENAYLNTGGVWTIGYGHTKNVKKGDKVTLEQAEKLYKQDFQEHIKPLKYVKVPLCENQKIALSSFIYNVGATAFKNSTLLKKLNNNDFEGAAKEFDKWIYDNGVKSNGLKNRREEEKNLFMTPDDL